MNRRLPITLLHMAVQHARPEENRSRILEGVRKAAQKGSRLIVLPEMAISGYSFPSVQEAEPFAESLDGPTLTGLREICSHYGVFCCIGMLEQDPETGLLHNSAIAIGPDGSTAAHHRKLVAERRWATPGNPYTRSWFDTPWGRVGMLVCADSYYGLPARTLALQGTDLILVLANWPPQGVDPRTLWRARALENGLGVIGCNRTGLDQMMDCREASSYAVTGEGEVLLDDRSSESRALLIRWPLSNGQMKSSRREHILETRSPRNYRPLGRDTNGLEDTTYLWGSAPSSPVDLQMLMPEHHPEKAHAQIREVLTPSRQGVVSMLPPGDLSTGILNYVERQVIAKDLPMIAGSSEGNPFLVGPWGIHTLSEDQDFHVAERDGFRLALVRPQAFLHPELAVSLAKLGCDLAFAPCQDLAPDLRTMLGVKCLERIPVALASPDESVLFLPPPGHEPWSELSRTHPGTLQIKLDSAAYRRRHIMDRLNLEVLCR
ncbi:carbon-nitrogen hydrolase family protein [Holophaga foetida]|uniref:carbon-nitrogen hydrolase family protein n=1 Tax=Holophaga foetida TaxID=35839 RepID=UPI00024750BE|nr:carbon-nitrogen hydrolase family protein [Holophaga foetida]